VRHTWHSGPFPHETRSFITLAASAGQSVIQWYQINNDQLDPPGYCVSKAEDTEISLRLSRLLYTCVLLIHNHKQNWSTVTRIWSYHNTISRLYSSFTHSSDLLLLLSNRRKPHHKAISIIWFNIWPWYNSEPFSIGCRRYTSSRTQNHPDHDKLANIEWFTPSYQCKPSIERSAYAWHSKEIRSLFSLQPIARHLSWLMSWRHGLRSPTPIPQYITRRLYIWCLTHPRSLW